MKMDVKSRCAICPGSFDPITNGHVDVIVRAAQIFDKVYVAIMANCEKHPVFTCDERIAQCRQVFAPFGNIEVISFDGLLADLAVKLDAVLVKGVRNSSDFEYEYALSQINASIDKRVETILLPAGKEFIYLSSTVVREVGKYGGDVSPFVPSCIAEELSLKLKERLQIKEG